MSANKELCKMIVEYLNKRTADEMFEELGFEIEYETDDEIVYENETYVNDRFFSCARITFDCVGGVACEFIQPNGKTEPYYVKEKELFAICKKYEELKDKGWL